MAFYQPGPAPAALPGTAAGVYAQSRLFQTLRQGVCAFGFNFPLVKSELQGKFPGFACRLRRKVFVRFNPAAFA
jgi:hypothetical protein